MQQLKRYIHPSKMLGQSTILLCALYSATPALAAINGLPPGPIQLDAAELDKQTYVAHALSMENARLDALSGVVYFSFLNDPDLSSAEATVLIDDAWTLISDHSPLAELDISHSTTAALTNIINHLVDVGSSGNATLGVQAFARDYVSQHFATQDLRRRLATWEFNYDEANRHESYRERIWEQLYELTSTDADLLTAINQSVITTTLISAMGDSTQDILNDNPDHPLGDFLTGKINPDGSLTLLETDIETTLDDHNLAYAQITDDYMVALVDLDDAYQAAITRALPEAVRDATTAATSMSLPSQPPVVVMGAKSMHKSTTDSELEEAINEAKTRAENLKPQVGNHQALAKALGFIAKAVKLADSDSQFAKDLGRIAKAYAKTIGSMDKFFEDTIKTAEKLTNLLGGGEATFNAISGIVFTGNMVGAFIEVAKLFNNSPTPEQKILQGIKELRDLILDIRTEFRQRFDRIDQNLNTIYTTMVDQFQIVNWDLGQVSGNVVEMQRQLYRVQADLNRIERNIYTFLDTGFGRDFVEDVDAYLGYYERTGVPIAYIPEYVDAESQFYTWSAIHASDELQSGDVMRDYDDDNLLNELTNYPLAFNINYLSQLPSERFALPVLHPLRLSNPIDWMSGANAYAQLAEESPAHHALIDPDRIDDVHGEGISLRAAFANIADQNLFDEIIDHYVGRLDAVETAIDNFEQAYFFDLDVNDNPLAEFDLWGGSEQMPAAVESDLIAAFQTAPRCSGSGSGAYLGGGILQHLLDNPDLQAFFLADHLDISNLDICASASWIDVEEEKVDEFPFNYWLIMAKPRLQLTLRYGGQTILNYTVTRQLPLILWGPQQPQCNSASPCALPNPYGYASQTDLSTETLVYSSPADDLREQADDDIGNLFEIQQQHLYASIIGGFNQGGDPLNVNAGRLNGSKELIKAYTALGMPVSTAGNELLRSLLYGPNSTGLADRAGIIDVYAYYLGIDATQADLPNRNIKQDIFLLADARVTELADLLTQIIDRIILSGEAETDRLLLPTMTRLELLRNIQLDFLTEAGADITVITPGVSVNFAQVDAPGTTSVVSILAEDAGALPSDFTALERMAYEISTDAAYSQSTNTCFTVPQMEDPLQFAALRVFQNDGSGLQDVTVRAPDPRQPDFLGKRICAHSGSLGDFVLALDTLDADANDIPDITEACNELGYTDQCAALSWPLIPRDADAQVAANVLSDDQFAKWELLLSPKLSQLNRWHVPAFEKFEYFALNHMTWIEHEAWLNKAQGTGPAPQPYPWQMMPLYRSVQQSYVAEHIFQDPVEHEKWRKAAYEFRDAKVAEDIPALPENDEFAEFFLREAEYIRWQVLTYEGKTG